MNRFICPISCNNQQVSCTKLEIFCVDLGIYFYVCVKIVCRLYYPYVKCVFFGILIMNMYVQCSYIESRNWYFKYAN
jgi:hypothetical protein